MKKILVLHGINLNMFGKRDPEQYGTVTLAQIDDEVKAFGRELGFDVECFQTNLEGEMAQRIHQAHEDGTDAVVINAGAWTHYSYGIADALAILEVPIVEVQVPAPLGILPGGKGSDQRVRDRQLPTGTSCCHRSDRKKKLG
jgi:3-dehydroquinate dehydratase-2